MMGNIITKKVQMEDNVIFHGHCISISNEERFESQVEKYLQEKAILEKAII